MVSKEDITKQLVNDLISKLNEFESIDTELDYYNSVLGGTSILLARL